MNLHRNDMDCAIVNLGTSVGDMSHSPQCGFSQGFAYYYLASAPLDNAVREPTQALERVIGGELRGLLE